MKDLIILGTGVHALEMAEIVERINAEKPTWRLRGYLSPDDRSVGEMRNGYPVLGSVSKLNDFPDTALVPGYGFPESIPIPHERLVSLIDPSCFVSRQASIGVGSVFYPHCYVGLNAKIGDFVFCLSGCSINHDDVLEDRVTLASGVRLAGVVHIESGSYLGQGCTIRQYLKVGQNSLIGMGAVVTKEVPPNSVMVGNPARKLKDRFTA